MKYTYIFCNESSPDDVNECIAYHIYPDGDVSGDYDNWDIYNSYGKLSGHR